MLYKLFISPPYQPDEIRISTAYSFNILRFLIYYILYIVCILVNHLFFTVALKIDLRIQIINQIPVAILHLNVHPKHRVINLIIPQVTIQLTPYSAAMIKMTTNAVAPPVAILLFKLLINIFSFFKFLFFHSSLLLDA